MFYYYVPNDYNLTSATNTKPIVSSFYNQPLCGGLVFFFARKTVIHIRYYYSLTFLERLARTENNLIAEYVSRVQYVVRRVCPVCVIVSSISYRNILYYYNVISTFKTHYQCEYWIFFFVLAMKWKRAC